MHDATTPAEFAEDEANFRAFINLDPHFAPAYADLASLYLMENKNLEQARFWTLQAIMLDQNHLGYYLLSGKILLKKGNAASALLVAEHAVALAKSPEDKRSAAKFLKVVETGQQQQAASMK